MRVGIYEVISILKESEDKRIALVQDKISKERLIERTIKHGYMDVYEQLLGLQNIHWPRVVEMQGNRVYEEYIEAPKLNETWIDPKDLICQLCDALSVLHTMQPPIIHRDIKPENIFIKDGCVILFDFDIARQYTPSQNRDTELLGSVGYAAPEQYGFGQSDPRTDIYALGILLKEMDRNAQYTSIAEKACAIDPDDRYTDVLQMKEAFQEPTWILPGVTDLKKGVSLLWIAAMVFIAAKTETPKDETPFLFQIEVFLFLYLILFFVRNRKRWKKRWMPFLYYWLAVFAMIFVVMLIEGKIL